MRKAILLALALATSPAHGQGADVQYYYLPEPTSDVCSAPPGSPCSIVECGLGWRCACPLVLPNGWKRPLTKEQCETARRTLPLYPAEEVRRHFDDGKASASGTRTGTDRPLDEKDMVSPRSEAARRLPDDEVCKLWGSGGGATMKRPTTCKYDCGTVLVCIEVDPPNVCPGADDPSGMSRTRWKNIKGLRPCKPKP
jgi:hypothetical protein